MSPIDREFLMFCVDMRLRGVHPGWLPIWRGSFEESGGDPRWTRKAKKLVEQDSWPMNCHFNKPKENGYLNPLRDRGQPWWDSVKEQE